MKDGKPYRLMFQKARNIEVIFAHIPNKRFSCGTSNKEEAVKFAEEFLLTKNVCQVRLSSNQKLILIKMRQPVLNRPGATLIGYAWRPRSPLDSASPLQNLLGTNHSEE